MTNVDVGKQGEQIAAEVLEDAGYRLLDRNWRGEGGEIDIVAMDGWTLAAVEVKTRSSWRFGRPAEAVTPAKIARLRRLLGQWIGAHPQQPRPRELRLDVVAVTLPPGGAPMIDLLRGVS